MDIHGRLHFEEPRINARLIRPGYHIGDACKDHETIGIKERQEFLDRKTGNFDELAFLATYEEHRPGSFTLLQEDLTFSQVNHHRFATPFSHGKFPGTYHLAVVASGQLQREQQKEPTLFPKILHAQSSLGLKLSSRRSEATLYWVGNHEAKIHVTPQDANGFFASPARMPSPIVKIMGKPVVSKHLNDFSGSHILRFRFKSQKKPFLHESGQSFTDEKVAIEGLEHCPVSLPATRMLEILLCIGDQTLRVSLPAFIGLPKTKKFLPAGDPRTFKIIPMERVAFFSLEEALGMGFSQESKPQKKHE